MSIVHQPQKAPCSRAVPRQALNGQTRSTNEMDRRWGLPLTESALGSWVDQATPGSRIAYHRGMLAWDVAPEAQVLGAPARAELARVASYARSMASAGIAHLVQRREGPGDFTYLLILRPRPRQQVMGAMQRGCIVSTDATARRAA